MIYDLIIEKLPLHDKSGKIGKISKNIGDTVKAGDTIFVVESGKGTIKCQSKYDGVLKELYISEGDIIEKGQIAGKIESDAVVKAENREQRKANYSFGISKPEKKSYVTDVAVVGGGPGGYVAAIRAAQGGKNVLLIEEDKLGGTCLNYGCIPTKTLFGSIDVLEKIKKAESFGIEILDFKPSIEKIMFRKNEVTNLLVSGIEHLMTFNGIELIKGKAEVNDKNTLIVKNNSIDAVIKFRKLIIATGSKSAPLQIEGADSTDILTSKQLLELSEIPNSITIIGGGVIGMEFAFIYSALGSKVNVVEYFPRILNNIDEDAVEIVRAVAIEKGIGLYEGAKAYCIKSALDGVKITEIELNGEKKYITSDKIAIAVGRKANIESLDLEKLGVKLNDKHNGIMVDEHMMTSNPDVYAIGDVTNKIQLAHVASHQGIVAADHINGINSSMNYDQIPSAVFTMPEIGQIGITEKIAKEAGLNYLVGKFPLSANGKAQAIGEPEGFVKLIANKETRKIIGGTIVGVHATDMISIITNLVALGESIDRAADVVYAHPTAAESIYEAILSLDNRGIHFA